MRTLVELVEEFIEALFLGDVITGVHDTQYVVLMRGENQDFVSVFTEQMDNLTDQDIPLFMSSEGSQKEVMAQKIFKVVLSMRTVGFLTNNPNSIKEVNFYRARSVYFEDRNKELTETVMALKAGRSGIG